MPKDTSEQRTTCGEDHGCLETMSSTVLYQPPPQMIHEKDLKKQAVVHTLLLKNPQILQSSSHLELLF